MTGDLQVARLIWLTQNL